MNPRALSASIAAVALMSAAIVEATGCDRDTDLRATLAADGGRGAGGEGGNASDGATDDGGPAITVTTLAPALTTAAPPTKTSATWAAYRLDDAGWRPLSPASEGTYRFPLPEARWTIALVCASADDSVSTVFVHHRTNATPDVTVTLDDACTPPAPPAEYAFTGTLTNLPPGTTWLDFGYARDSRGDAIPVTGTTGTYEIVGIEPGTWDFSFGVRDDSFHALTRFVLRRGHPVSADEVVDVDVAGPGSFAPGTKAVTLHGLRAGDTVVPAIFYAAGGPFGIDVGPQDVPDGMPDVTLAYSTVPESAQIPTDRYRGELSAEQDRRTGTRTVTFEVHRALELDVGFLPDPALPVVKVISSAPQVVLETTLDVLPGAEHHEVIAQASSDRRSPHTIRSTYDAIYVGSSPQIVDTTPDLSAVPGWKAAWGLVSGAAATVFAASYEKPQPLGDGTMQRSATKGVTVTP